VLGVSNLSLFLWFSIGCWGWSDRVIYFVFHQYVKPTLRCTWVIYHFKWPLSVNRHIDLSVVNSICLWSKRVLQLRIIKPVINTVIYFLSYYGHLKMVNYSHTIFYYDLSDPPFTDVRITCIATMDCRRTNINIIVNLIKSTFSHSSHHFLFLMCWSDSSVFNYMIYSMKTCVGLLIVLSNTYCVVFLFCLSSSCVPYVASFSGLPILVAPSVFSNVYMLSSYI
jgi:hypothetical protein